MGSRSETLSDLQLELLTEQEPGLSVDDVEADAQSERIEKTTRRERKPHPGRERLPANLPRVEQVMRCQERTCKECGQKTTTIGYDESEQLDVEPAR